MRHLTPTEAIARRTLTLHVTDALHGFSHWLVCQDALDRAGPSPSVVTELTASSSWAVPIGAWLGVRRLAAPWLTAAVANSLAVRWDGGDPSDADLRTARQAELMLLLAPGGREWQTAEATLNTPRRGGGLPEFMRWDSQVPRFSCRSPVTRAHLEGSVVDLRPLMASPGETQAQFLDRAILHYQARRRLFAELGAPPLKKRSHETVVRNVGWLVRERLDGFSLRAIVEADPEFQGRGADWATDSLVDRVRVGIARARKLCDILT